MCGSVASWIIDVSMPQIWLPVEMMAENSNFFLLENPKLFTFSDLCMGFVVSFFFLERHKWVWADMQKPSNFPSWSLSQRDSRAKGSFKDPVWTHLVRVYVGVCVGVTLALKDVGLGLMFFVKHSYLAGCALWLVCVCVSPVIKQFSKWKTLSKVRDEVNLRFLFIYSSSLLLNCQEVLKLLH